MGKDRVGLEERDTMELSLIEGIPVPDDEQIRPDQRKTIEVRRSDVKRPEQVPLLHPIANKFPILFSEVRSLVRLLEEVYGKENDSHFGISLSSCRSLLSTLTKTDVSAINVQFMINQRALELQSLLADPDLDKKVREAVSSAIICLREHEPLILSGEVAGKVFGTTGAY